MSLRFRRFHLVHHRRMGEDGVDWNIPTKSEVERFQSTLGKFIWISLQTIFVTMRESDVHDVVHCRSLRQWAYGSEHPTCCLLLKKPACQLEQVNNIVQLAFDLVIFKLFGIKALAYLTLGTLLMQSLHPSAGHFIAEHYVTDPRQETYSYYGPMNLMMFNVGYHVEHHDFPYIGCGKLPLVRKIAPEFYDGLVHYNSWIWVLYNVIFDPKMGPHSRIKRKPKAEC